MKTSTAGRICLFGEHQDYLGLPVIAMAISRRVSIEGEKRKDNKIIIHKPNIGVGSEPQEEEFLLTNPLLYTQKRDYFKSAITVLRRKGFQFSTGFEVTINGNIPINSGTSSSSALLVSWIHFLTLMADNQAVVSQKELGEFAYEAEVLEFGEPGGMMDQYSTAVGNIIYLASTPKISIEQLTPKLGSFVLGDSITPKDTLGILERCRFGMENIIEKVSKKEANFSIFTTNYEQANDYKNILTQEELNLLKANLEDRDILREGKLLLENSLSFGEDWSEVFGNLLNRHQRNLREFKQTSTKKIDKMLEVALNAGAFGGKINGSGGGGCMFAYAPNNPEEVAEAIERAGGKSYIIAADEGTRIEK